MRLCSVPGCERAINGKEFCRLHRMRLRTGTNMLAPPGFRHGFALAFIDKAVGYTGVDCLIWPYSTARGYGKVGIDGKVVSTHNYVCRAAHGAPPSHKHEVAHTCGNRLCVAPSHLRWATSQENETDKLVHGRHNRGERNGFAKMTVDAVRAIRARPYRPLNELAMEYGVSKQTACKARLRQTWRWLEDKCFTH